MPGEELDPAAVYDLLKDALDRLKDNLEVDTPESILARLGARLAEQAEDPEVIHLSPRAAEAFTHALDRPAKVNEQLAEALSEDRPVRPVVLPPPDLNRLKDNLQVGLPPDLKLTDEEAEAFLADIGNSTVNPTVMTEHWDHMRIPDHLLPATSKCRNCGKETRTMINRGTGWCSEDCRKKLEDRH